MATYAAEIGTERAVHVGAARPTTLMKVFLAAGIGVLTVSVIGPLILSIVILVALTGALAASVALAHTNALSVEAIAYGHVAIAIAVVAWIGWTTKCVVVARRRGDGPPLVARRPLLVAALGRAIVALGGGAVGRSPPIAPPAIGTLPPFGPSTRVLT